MFEKASKGLAALTVNVPAKAPLQSLEKELNMKLEQVEKEAENLLEQLGELRLGRVD